MKSRVDETSASDGTRLGWILLAILVCPTQHNIARVLLPSQVTVPPVLEAYRTAG